MLTIESGQAVTESAARPSAVTAHDSAEHLGRGAEGDGAHEAVVDGEVEDDLGSTEMEPGAAWPVTDEDRKRCLGAAVGDNRIAVRFQYECHDSAGQWFRSYGNELWEFDDKGLMRRREASINDLAISEGERRLFGSRNDQERAPGYEIPLQ